MVDRETVVLLTPARAATSWTVTPMSPPFPATEVAGCHPHHPPDLHVHRTRARHGKPVDAFPCNWRHPMKCGSCPSNHARTVDAVAGWGFIIGHSLSSMTQVNDDTPGHGTDGRLGPGCTLSVRRAEAAVTAARTAAGQGDTMSSARVSRHVRI